jgi:hypothetical protein
MVDEAAWEPPGVEPATLASEWIVEARSGGACVVRLVVSGFGSGAGWDEEVRGFGQSMAQALRMLRLYLRRFRGRHGHPVTARGRARGSLDAAFAAFAEALELPAAAVGARLDAPFGLAGTVEEVDAGEWRRDLLVRLDRPAPGFAALSVFAEARWTVIQASLFGDEAAEIAAREQPRWEAWMAERFPDAP